MDTKRLRQKILDLAIRGKLVPQDPNDEPASVLLERIRAEKERLIAEGKIKRPKKSKASSSESHYQKFEPPFPIPDNWEWVSIGDISSLILYGVSESAKETGQFKLLRITDIQNNHVNWDSVPLTDFPSEKALSYILHTGDILFARTGATVGKSYLVDKCPLNAIYASYLIRIQTFPEIEPAYLKYFFESGFYWQQISEGSVGIGQPNVNGTSLGLLKFPVPPKLEQERIVDALKQILNTVESIEINKQKILSFVNQTKSKILELAMQGKLVPQDPADEPAADMLRRINPKARIITDNPHYPQLPDNWALTRFNEVCDSKLGKTLNSETDEGHLQPYLCALNVKQGFFDLNIVKRTKIQPSEYDRFSVLKGDLLVCEGGDVGRAAIWENDRIFYQNALHRVRPYNGIIQKYLYYCLAYSKIKKWIEELCSGVTIKHFTTKSMSNLIISLPSTNEQIRIVSKIEKIFTILEKIEETLN